MKFVVSQAEEGTHRLSIDRGIDVYDTAQSAPSQIALSRTSDSLAAEQPWGGIEQERECRPLSCMGRPTPTWKRSVDVVLSLTLMILLSPLLLAIAVYIKLVSGAPILFRQERLGYRGRSFVIYKFRTLTCDPKATSEHRQFIAKICSSNEVASKPDFEGRTIPGGHFLRSTSLDELPQLVNILLGDMSLIGPRPDVLEWNDYHPWQTRRFEVVPGVTGLWQVSGKNRLTFNEMIEKDIEYVENRSVGLDLVIALKTFRLLLQRDNT